MLSGGIDSASVAAAAMRLVNGDRRPIGGYSAVFPDHPSADESQFIDRICHELRLPSVRIVVRGGSVLGGALEYLREWQLPPVSPLYFWHPLLARCGEDGVRALLDGEGGDEVFGLSPYLLADRLRRGRLLSAIRLVHRIPGLGPSPPRWAVRDVLTKYGLRGAVPLRLHEMRRRRRDPAIYVPDWFRPETARLFMESDGSWDWKGLDGPRWWSFLAGAVAGGFGSSVGLDHKRRRCAMAGIDVRHPLVDVDVVELVLRLPPELAFDPRFNRPLLRESMAGLVPDELRLRSDKSNFDAVFHQGLADSDLQAVRRLLTARDAEVQAYVRPEAMQAWLFARPPRESHGGLMRWALAAWRLTTAECWLRAQADPGWLDRIQGSERLREASYELVGPSA
jgi:asparagine synthase (glutamine-hydrolysing)